MGFSFYLITSRGYILIIFAFNSLNVRCRDGDPFISVGFFLSFISFLRGISISSASLSRNGRSVARVGFILFPFPWALQTIFLSFSRFKGLKGGVYLGASIFRGRDDKTTTASREQEIEELSTLLGPLVSFYLFAL